jgi:hypothetical protein
MARGWKGNALGLQRWQMQLAHETAVGCMVMIQKKVLAGMTFDAAKAAVIRQESPGWKGFTPDVAKAVYCIVSSYTYGDLHPSIHRKHADEFLAGIEARRGYKTKGLELLMYRWFGMVWSVEPKAGR